MQCGATRVLNDVPGAVVEVVYLGDGIRAELNGAGSVVGYIYDYGFQDDSDYDDDGWESPEDRVKRLAGELKEARKALPRKAKGDAA